MLRKVIPSFDLIPMSVINYWIPSLWHAWWVSSREGASSRRSQNGQGVGPLTLPTYRGKAVLHANSTFSSRVNLPLGFGVSQLSAHTGLRSLGKAVLCSWEDEISGSPPVPGDKPSGWLSRMSDKGYGMVMNAHDWEELMFLIPRCSAPGCRSQAQYWWIHGRCSPSPALPLDAL